MGDDDAISKTVIRQYSISFNLCDFGEENMRHGFLLINLIIKLSNAQRDYFIAN